MLTLTASDKSHLIAKLHAITALATSLEHHHLIPFALVGDTYYTIGASAYYVASILNVDPDFDYFRVNENDVRRLPVVGVVKPLMTSMTPLLNSARPVAVLFAREESPSIDLVTLYDASGEAVAMEARQA